MADCIDTTQFQESEHHSTKMTQAMNHWFEHVNMFLCMSLTLIEFPKTTFDEHTFSKEQKVYATIAQNSWVQLLERHES